MKIKCDLSYDHKFDILKTRQLNYVMGTKINKIDSTELI